MRTPCNYMLCRHPARDPCRCRGSPIGRGHRLQPPFVTFHHTLLQGPPRGQPRMIAAPALHACHVGHATPSLLPIPPSLSPRAAAATHAAGCHPNQGRRNHARPAPLSLTLPLPPVVMWPARAAPLLAGGAPLHAAPAVPACPLSHMLCLAPFFTRRPALHQSCDCFVFALLPNLPATLPFVSAPPDSSPDTALGVSLPLPPPPPGLSMPCPRRGLFLRSPPPGRPRSIVGAKFFSVCTPLSPNYVPPCTDACLPFPPCRCTCPTNAAPAFIPLTPAPYTPCAPPTLPGAPLLPCQHCVPLDTRWQNPYRAGLGWMPPRQHGTGGSAHHVAPLAAAFGLRRRSVAPHPNSGRQLQSVL